jgi:hypothetical protein
VNQPKLEAIALALNELARRVAGYVPAENHAHVAGLFNGVREAVGLPIKPGSLPRTLPTTDELLETMRAMVLQRAATEGNLQLNEPYADNSWVVEVFPGGRTCYNGYAEEARGRYGSLADLQMWELAHLLTPRR